MIPSTRFVFLPVFATMRIKIVTAIRIAVSMIISGTALIGVKVDAIPRINKILKRQEPTALPSAIPESPFLEAVMEVTSSGREVPIATMVRPTSVSLMPHAFAIRLALSTTLRILIASSES